MALRDSAKRVYASCTFGFISSKHGLKRNLEHCKEFQTNCRETLESFKTETSALCFPNKCCLLDVLALRISKPFTDFIMDGYTASRFVRTLHPRIDSALGPNQVSTSGAGTSLTNRWR